MQKSSPRKRSVNTPFEDGSDESETSSICSEKSTDYARRTSDVSFYKSGHKPRGLKRGGGVYAPLYYLYSTKIFMKKKILVI